MAAGGPVKPGDRLRILASEKNDWNTVAAAHKRNERGVGVPGNVHGEAQDGVAMVSNGSGQDIAAFGIIGLSVPMFDADESPAAFKWQQSMRGESPSVATHDGRFGVYLEPCTTDSVKAAAIAGVVPVQVDITDTAHRFASVISGDTTKLQSSDNGSAQILAKSTDAEGVQWCYVRLGHGDAPALKRFGLTSALDLGGAATARQVAYDDSGDSYGLTGDTFTVKDFTATPGSWQGAIGFRGWCLAMPDSGVHEIVWMETFAKFVECTLLAGFSSGSTTATVNDWYDIKAPTASPITVLDPQNQFSRALTGAKCLAWYNPREDVYIAVECQSQAGFVEGTANADISSSSVAGTVNQFGGSQQDIQEPASDPTFYDAQGLFKHIKTGSKMVGGYDAISDTYSLFNAQTLSGVVEVTLAGEFTAGVSSGATMVRCYGSQQDIQDHESTLEITDDQGSFPRAKSGAKCKAFFDAEANKLRAFWCEQIGFLAKATLTAAMDGSAPTFSGFTIISPSPFNLAPASVPTTSSNTAAHQGLSGDTVWLVWDDAASAWEVFDVTKHSDKVFRAFQLVSGQLQGEAATVALERSTAWAWENLIATDECTT